MENWNASKLNVCVSKDTTHQINTTDGSKYLQIMYLIRDLYPEYIKNSYNSIVKKMN